MRVLVVEDGFEYSETLGQFLPHIEWVRAGSGGAALEVVGDGFDAVFLDMRFDRVQPHELMGDFDATADRFNGDAVQAQQFLEDHQGLFVLAALREAGCGLFVLMSYDFDGELQRWDRIESRQGPVAYLPDNASPADIEAALTRGASSAR